MRETAWHRRIVTVVVGAGALLLVIALTSACSSGTPATQPTSAPQTVGVSATPTVTADAVAGTWAFTDADLTLDPPNGAGLQINDGSGHGGLIVSATAPDYTVTVVDKSGKTTDPLPATVTAGIVRFTVPAPDGGLPSALMASGGGLVVQFGDEETHYRLVRVSSLPTQTP